MEPWVDKIYTAYQFENPDNDPKGKWFSGSLSFSEERSNPKHPNYYSITSPSKVVWIRQWQVTQQEMEDLIAQGDIFWGLPPAYDKVPRKKIRPDVDEVIPANIFDECGTTKSAEKEVEKLMGCPCFSYPKPHKLIEKLLSLITIDDDICLDFFSGSATTAHAVMQRNI